MRLLQTQSFADSFRHGYAVPPHPFADGISEGGLYPNPIITQISRENKSDIIAAAIVILKPCGFSDILFAHKLA